MPSAATSDASVAEPHAGTSGDTAPRHRDREPPAGDHPPDTHELENSFLGAWPYDGVRSNPQAEVTPARLGALHDELLRKALANPREPRPLPAKVSPVLETVTLALERAEEPMRALEIHAAAREIVGEPVLWSSVKSALSAGADR